MLLAPLILFWFEYECVNDIHNISNEFFYMGMIICKTVMSYLNLYIVDLVFCFMCKVIYRTDVFSSIDENHSCIIYLIFALYYPTTNFRHLKFSFYLGNMSPSMNPETSLIPFCNTSHLQDIPILSKIL